MGIFGMAVFDVAEALEMLSESSPGGRKSDEPAVRRLATTGADVLLLLGTEIDAGTAGVTISVFLVVSSSVFANVWIVSVGGASNGNSTKGEYSFPYIK